MTSYVVSDFSFNLGETNISQEYVKLFKPDVPWGINTTYIYKESSLTEQFNINNKHLVIENKNVHGNIIFKTQETGRIIINDLSVNSINGVPYSGIGSGTGIGGVSLTLNSVNSSHIQDGSILGIDICDGTITTSKIADGTILGTDISIRTITGSNIALGTIDSVNMSSSFYTTLANALTDISINSSNIVNGSILGIDISDNTITNSKIADATIEGSKIANSTINLSHLSASLVSTITDISINSFNIIDGSILGTDICANTITGSNIATGTITSSNIANGTILGTDISNGTITRDNIAEGTIFGSNISSNTIYGYHLVNGTITSSKIENGTILGTDISHNTITGSNIALQTINGSNMSSTFFSTLQTTINNNVSITSSNIVNGSILGIDICNGTISYEKFDNTVATFLGGIYTGIFEISNNVLSDTNVTAVFKYVENNNDVILFSGETIPIGQTRYIQYFLPPYFTELLFKLEVGASIHSYNINPTAENGIINNSVVGNVIVFNIKRNSHNYLIVNIKTRT